MSTTLSRSAPPTTGIALRPLHPAFGAEISGLDLATPLAAGMLEVLHDALIEHGVLLLRDQRALPQCIARGLAALEAPWLGQALHQAAPALPLSVGAVPDLPPPGQAARPFWHADRSYAAEPGLACLMRADAPAGTIAFADQRAALAGLPSALRARLESLRAVHESPLDRTLRAEHPLVRRHPVTGDASLYADPAFTTRILNLPMVESDLLLGAAFATATAEAITWRHDWQSGDVLVWDNRRMLHTASSGPGLDSLRIEGDLPRAAALLDMPWVIAG
ncbi:MAG: TauD/TfdA dioxygenase family protein [Paracraurococcus sp.]